MGKQMVVVDRALVQGLMQYFLRQPLGEVLNFYQLLQQALISADTAAVKAPSPPPPNPAE